MTENDISYKIRGAIFKVYNNLGPGLLESIYPKALTYVLKKEGLKVEKKVSIPVIYDDIELDVGFRLDLLIKNKVSRKTSKSASQTSSNLFKNHRSFFSSSCQFQR